jgi:hypothetical protein
VTGEKVEQPTEKPLPKVAVVGLRRLLERMLRGEEPRIVLKEEEQMKGGGERMTSQAQRARDTQLEKARTRILVWMQRLDSPATACVE